MHTPVMVEKVLEILDPQANEDFIDCTAGAGGHTTAILEKTAPKGKVLAIDWNEEAIQILKVQMSKSKFKRRLIVREGNFAELKEIARLEKFSPVHGILFDLGFSSDQLEGSGRGFSFQKDEPLDMRYSKQNPTTAEKLLNYTSKSDLERILKEYGQERFAGQIAQAVADRRRAKALGTTFELVRIVEQATPAWYRRRNIHPATKTFQALRIAVNNELEHVKEGLTQAAELVNPQGAIAAISFHSGEDRVVKEFFKHHPSLQLLSKKPMTPSQTEIRNNPRARSAKLRAAKKV